ncbi:MAG: SGNH/GDSL hydrolase family protein [Oscillospiraceae bacterium]
MNISKYAAILTAAALSSAMLSGCGASEDTSSDAPADTAAEQTAAETVQTHGLLTTAALPTEPVDLSAGLTEAMYERALLNEGDLTRLAAAMKKAENGEPVTVGVIGGSITQGTAASNNALCYASLFFQWWQEKFPECQINTVNAGIGGTNSYLGVNRVDEQLLSADPDVVIVEFSVNDTDKVMNKYSYDSLVRKILSYKTNPAVILLFTTQEDGTSLQDVHKEIGAAYDLPMLSYREVVYPEVAAGTLAWSDISPDNIHPNDEGHSLIGQLLSRYLDSVYDKKDTIAEEPSAFDMAGYTSDYYKNAKMYFPSTLEAELEGFEVGTNTVYPDKFPENWVSAGGGTMTFTADFQTMGLFYLCTTDGKGGQFDVYVDGERRGSINSDFSGGWGNYGATDAIFTSSSAETHTVEIKAIEGSEDKTMTILGVMLS